MGICFTESVRKSIEIASEKPSAVSLDLLFLKITAYIYNPKNNDFCKCHHLSHVSRNTKLHLSVETYLCFKSMFAESITTL